MVVVQTNIYLSGAHVTVDSITVKCLNPGVTVNCVVTVTDNSPFQDYPYPDDHTTQSTVDSILPLSPTPQPLQKSTS